MKLCNPLLEKNIQRNLSLVAQDLRNLEADDWANDIEQTAHSIQKDFDDARKEIEKNRIDELESSIDALIDEIVDMKKEQLNGFCPYLDPKRRADKCKKEDNCGSCKDHFIEWYRNEYRNAYLKKDE